MDTKELDLGGVKVTICRMTPLTYTQYQDENERMPKEHGRAVNFMDSKSLYRFIEQTMLPETIRKVELASGKSFEATADKLGRNNPCVTSKFNENGSYFLGDLGSFRVWEIASEVIRFSVEPDATFLGSEAAKQRDEGDDLPAGKDERADAQPATKRQKPNDK